MNVEIEPTRPVSNDLTRSVLIVTPFFAPQSHAAVFRAYKLAKYLPSVGWKPYVLTVDCNYRFNEDPALLDSLPAETEIHTARHIEPTLRGLRMALGGRDRRFTALKRADARLQNEAPVRSTSRLHQTYALALQRFHAPDEYWTWHGPAVRKARALIRKHRIPIVFTTAMPYTSHRIGLTLKQQGLGWVADFRDPGTYAAKMSSSIRRVYNLQRQIERDTLRRADVVTVASSIFPMLFQDEYTLDRSAAARFIPTGADEVFVSAPPRRLAGLERYIVFCGEFLPDYGREFLEVFARALERCASHDRAKLLIVGRLEVNQRVVGPIVRDLALEEQVRFLDHMPQSDLYPIIKGAMAAVLAPGSKSHWWNLFAKLIDFIALRTRVIAIVPNPSEARLHLTDTGLGVFLDGDRETRTEALVAFLEGRCRQPHINGAACDRFLASRQVQDFAEVFEWCLAQSHVDVRRADRRKTEPAWAI